MSDRLRGCFVTGTDTGVGKSLVSASLLYLLHRQGIKAVGFKPVAAGLTLIDGMWVNEDVHMLCQASALCASEDEIGPYQLTAACSPHIAAMLERRVIDLEKILSAAQVLNAYGEGLIVEGAGGFRVPLGEGWDSADMVCAFGLPVIVVVGMRLGCLNHALLTVEAIQRRGLSLAGWVGNVIDAEMPYLDDNIQTLRQALLPVPCLGVIPWSEKPVPLTLMSYLDVSPLNRLFHQTSS